MDAVLFWDMTYKEIVTTIEVYNKKIETNINSQMQINASIAYRLGELVSFAFNDPKNYPKDIREAFPKIFDDTSNDNEGKQQDWQIMKERMSRYAYLHKKRGERA